ncbi:MAG TPA: hypothetical protein VIN10_02540 [Bacteroidales bacterium]
MRPIVITILAISLSIMACKKNNIDSVNTTDKIIIDSLTATFYTVKAWDTTTISCFARGDSLIYSWECDHGNFNGNGHQIRYAAGQCCIGINTITCAVSNNNGKVSKEIKIEVTSYYEK